MQKRQPCAWASLLCFLPVNFKLYESCALSANRSHTGKDNALTVQQPPGTLSKLSSRLTKKHCASEISASFIHREDAETAEQRVSLTHPRSAVRCSLALGEQTKCQASNCQLVMNR